MTVLVALIVGFFAGRLLWVGLRPTWNAEDFPRQSNYRGINVPIAAGIVLPLAVLLVEAGRGVAGAFGLGTPPEIAGTRAAIIVGVVGFALLGLLDDLIGDRSAKGLVGHLRSLVSGRLTTGGLKMLGGGVVALIAAAFLSTGAVGLNILIDGAVIALAANLVNLFDLRPGRASKVGLFAFALLAVGSLFNAGLVPVAVVAGAVLALFLDDLRERLMLGDTGSNALGAAIGVGIVSQVGEAGSLIALIGLLGMTLASEFISFSKVIDKFPPFRAIDMLGRKPNTSDTVDVRDAPPEEPGGGYSEEASSRATVEAGAEAGRMRSSGPANSRSQDRPFSSDPVRRDEPGPFKDRIADSTKGDTEQERW
jgi:UDP-N-acetylmuramyl pentapeptide phosphotransferase/UDP-N-acetylglucosamine-1-phosphate transferase